MSRATPRAATAVVVAHPDDEALWLSSVLAEAGQVVFCYGDPWRRPVLAAARRRAVAALPLRPLVDLRIPESGAGFAVDWPEPALTPFGVAINEAATGQRYEVNYAVLLDALRPVLAGCADVYTHNPWGEYGHAEHLQVYRAVAALQAELGFTLWFSNYVGPRSWQLARRLSPAVAWVERRAEAPDEALARRLMRVYAQAGAWTWSRLHRWPRYETLYAQRPVGAPQSLAGAWLLDASRLRWWPPPWRPARRRLD